jgi:hypothetical protein
MPQPYRVLITGSRDWPKPADVFTALNHVQQEAHGRLLVVVHGACPTGADAYARHWARAHQQQGEPVIEDPHRAQWRHGGRVDRGAGYRRNAHMVSLGAEVCLAFIGPCAKPGCREPQPHGSHGTTHCAGLAEAAGIPVRRWTA